MTSTNPLAIDTLSAPPPLRLRLGSFLTAGLLVGGLLLGMRSLRPSEPLRAEEPPVTVTFVEEAPQPKPVKVSAKKQAAPAPVVPKHLKKIVVDKLPPARPLEVPAVIPEGPLPEADPSLDKGVLVLGEGAGDPAGIEGGQEGGVAGGEPVRAPVEVPDAAEPPVPFDDNAVPAYPPAAKEAGLTGTVILKIVVDEEGRVADVKVMRGQEPFLSAVVDVVRTWRYSPARLDGKPLRVFRLVRIPFHLTE